MLQAELLKVAANGALPNGVGGVFVHTCWLLSGSAAASS